MEVDTDTAPLWKEIAVIGLALAILMGLVGVVVSMVLGDFSSTMSYVTGTMLAMLLGAGFVWFT